MQQQWAPSKALLPPARELHPCHCPHHLLGKKEEAGWIGIQTTYQGADRAAEVNHSKGLADLEARTKDSEREAAIAKERGLLQGNGGQQISSLSAHKPAHG